MEKGKKIGHEIAFLNEEYVAVRKEKVALDQCKKWIRCANCQFSLIKNQCRTRPNSVQEIVNILNLTMKVIRNALGIFNLSLY